MKKTNEIIYDNNGFKVQYIKFGNPNNEYNRMMYCLTSEPTNQYDEGIVTTVFENIFELVNYDICKNEFTYDNIAKMITAPALSKEFEYIIMDKNLSESVIYDIFKNTRINKNGEYSYCNNTISSKNFTLCEMALELGRELMVAICDRVCENSLTDKKYIKGTFYSEPRVMKTLENSLRNLYSGKVTIEDLQDKYDVKQEEVSLVDLIANHIKTKNDQLGQLNLDIEYVHTNLEFELDDATKEDMKLSEELFNNIDNTTDRDIEEKIAFEDEEKDNQRNNQNNISDDDKGGKDR